MTNQPQHRILVVDDNPDAATSLSLLIKLAGQNVRTATGGEGAIALAKEFQPDLVLLDIGMPGMDGYQVARRLRQEFSGKPLVLVALTGWNEDEDRRRSKEAGFDHHLVKPVEPETLNNLFAALNRDGK